MTRPKREPIFAIWPPLFFKNDFTLDSYKIFWDDCGAPFVNDSSQSNWSPFFLKDDFSAGIVVALISLPLCLGIALASNAPLFSGLVTGTIGCFIVAVFSRSPLAVAGPAAGMSVIVLKGISDIGSFEGFLFALFVAGIIQFLLGIVRLGGIGNIIPSSVIKGMMASIGLVLIAKQIPHGFGYDIHPEGEDSFVGVGGENIFLEISHAFTHFHATAILIFITSIILIIVLNTKKYREHKLLKIIPAPLWVVIIGILINHLVGFTSLFESLSVSHLVQIPNVMQSKDHLFILPDFSVYAQSTIYVVALTVALVGSLETIASMEAVEKLDPYHRQVPPNHELCVQGGTNMLMGLLGGIPLTTVILRSSANIIAGGKSKWSNITQCSLMIFYIVVFAKLINLIPLSSLAVILIYYGYKLTAPSLYGDLYKKGYNQFIPFIATIIVTFFTNLLTGLLAGLVIGVLFTLNAGFHHSIIVTRDESYFLVKLAKDVSFLNKGRLRKVLSEIPPQAEVIIDGAKSGYVDEDIIEIIEDFQSTAKLHNIKVYLKKSRISGNSYFFDANSSSLELVS